MDARAVAAALRVFAEDVERLPAHDRRHPHSFTEGKSDIAAAMVALADALTARPAPPRPIRPRPIRPRQPVTIAVKPHDRGKTHA